MDITAAVQALQEGLLHMDSYEPVPSDDSKVAVVSENEEWEFATSTGQLQLGHLRTILAFFSAQQE